MINKVYKKIFKEIKKHNVIVIARHIGPDPDALGSSIGLKEIIKYNFPNKKVYAVGSGTIRFSYLGVVDHFDEIINDDTLLIVTDTPDKKRIDGADVNSFKNVIKMDHHPFVESFGGIEYIDDTASSASQIVIDFAFQMNLKIPVNAAEKLYIGLIADTNRFLFKYTTPKTFSLVSKLIETTSLDFTKLYEPLYLRPMKELKFQSYILNSLKVTENGFGFAYITDDILKEYGVDAATAGNMVNNFNYIEEVIAWAVFSEDKVNNNIRISIRSRGPIINEAAAKFGGGGHAMASGVKLSTFDECDKLVLELDKVCREYQNNI